MKNSLFHIRHMQADVLVIGGGLAGCSAAIRARELGASALLVEKSHVRRSGNACSGVDHTWCYFPEAHDPQGFTPRQLLEDHLARLGPMQDHDMIMTIAENIGDRIKELETWGFPFKTNGKYNFVKKIHRVPSFMHWAGRDQKVLFEQKAREVGTDILNRVMIIDLLKQNGRVVGALGMGLREPIIYIFSSRAVVMASGGISRIFPPATCLDFNRQRLPFGTGDGIAMGIRAGAEMVRLEFFTRWAGLHNLCKAGRGTWIGVVEDAAGNPLSGNRNASSRTQIDAAVESYDDVTKAWRDGRGPLYMSCLNTSREDFDYMCWALSNEGNQVLLQQLHDCGLDPRRTRIEFSSYEPEITGGFAPDTKCATNVPGLFAAGGEVIGNMKRSASPSAYVFGKIAGESAVHSARENVFTDMKSCSETIAWHIDRLQRMRLRTQGARWQEATGACQDIMGTYCCETKYENLLNAGYEQLLRVRRRAEQTLCAAGQHELGRCLEAFNLMDIAEAALLCSRERRETRLNRYDPFRRVDHAEENPAMDKFLVYSCKDNQASFRWRAMRVLN